MQHVPAQFLLIFAVLGSAFLSSCGGGGGSSNPAGSTTNTVTAVASLSVSPATVAFGEVQQQSSSTRQISLLNNGNASVTVSAANVTGSEFSVSGPALPTSIAAGASVAFNVVFTPTTSGDAAGTVTFVSSASNSPAVVSMSGRGGHAVELSWDASSTPTVAGYYVYRSERSGGPYTRVTANEITGTRWLDTTVQPGHTFYYVVTAVDLMNDESGYSNEAQAKIPED
jgi:hypothetical protein